MKLRAATNTDGYKLSHAEMYVDGTESVYSNLTPRSDKHYKNGSTRFYDGKLVFVGGQGAIQEIQELWDDTFFNQPKEKVIKQFASRMEVYLGGEIPATARLSDLHDLGYLPIKVKTLQEGSKVNMGIPVLTITNTNPKFFWLVNYLETIISNLMWKTSTNATTAAEYKAIMEHYAALTGVDDFTVSIQCHGFEQRGMSGPEDSARAGFAHLTSFIGTDTLPAIDYAEDYYDATGLIALSVPATEHAVATNNILSIERDILEGAFICEEGFDSRLHAEKVFLRDLITRKFPKGVVSYVSDSFDYWSVITKILPALKSEILSREALGESPGKTVVRPDSGDPVQVICGIQVYDIPHSAEEIIGNEDGAYDSVADIGYTMSDGIEEEVFYVLSSDQVLLEICAYFECERYYGNWSLSSYSATGVELTPEQKGSIQCLWETFGGTLTSTGHKLLDSHIGLIYGDSITTKRAEEILRRLEAKGFASGNVVLGVGSYTYQHVTRDTFGQAIKATYSVVNGEPVNIFKDPITDPGKKSARGLLKVVKSDDGFILQDQVSLQEENEGELKTIFQDGEWIKRTTLEEIRQRLTGK